MGFCALGALPKNAGHGDAARGVLPRPKAPAAGQPASLLRPAEKRAPAFGRGKRRVEV